MWGLLRLGGSKATKTERRGDAPFGYLWAIRRNRSSFRYSMREMRQMSRSITIAILGASVLTVVAVTVNGELEIARSTVAGGGVMHSRGATLRLSGTIGQPVVTQMMGGALELTGGSWFEIGPTDCNDDGVVSLADHASFIDCLTGPGAGVLSGCECFDADRRGTVDLFAFAILQRAFSSN